MRLGLTLVLLSLSGMVDPRVRIRVEFMVRLAVQQSDFQRELRKNSDVRRELCKNRQNYCKHSLCILSTQLQKLQKVLACVCVSPEVRLEILSSSFASVRPSVHKRTVTVCVGAQVRFYVDIPKQRYYSSSSRKGNHANTPHI